MNITEATKARTREQPFIRRKAWDYEITADSKCAAILQRPKYRILPTNTPEGCLSVSQSSERPKAGWSPTEEDLLAEDWELVPLGR